MTGLTDGAADLYSSIGRTRTTDSVVAQLQKLILDKKLKVGDGLPAERDLALRLSVSRNVLREALGVLAQRGLVQPVAGRGTFVSSPTAGHITDTLRLMLQLGDVSLEELCHARLLIEPELAARAAGRTSGPDDVVQLGLLMERLDQAHDDALAHVEADIAFHAEIARLAHHSVFEAIVNAVREPVVQSMMVGLKVPRAINASDEQHRKIYNAIAAAQVDGAREAMDAHMRYVTSYISGEANRATKATTKNPGRRPRRTTARRGTR